MIVHHERKVNAEQVKMEGAESVSIKWLIGKDSPAPSFYLRQFEVAPGGHTPLHTHAWEHEVYVLEGEGQINGKDHSHPLKKGSFVLVEPEEMHQFVNTGQTVFKFLCIVPK